MQFAEYIGYICDDFTIQQQANCILNINPKTYSSAVPQKCGIASLKEYRDIKGYIETAFHEGEADVAKKLKDKGMDINFIMETTGLSKSEIDKL